MKIRYYLRGLGTGILVTTIIITISNSIRNNEAKLQKLTSPQPTDSHYQTVPDSSGMAAGDKTSGAGTQQAETAGVNDTPAQSRPESTAAAPKQTEGTIPEPTEAVTTAQTEPAPVTSQTPANQAVSEVTVSFNSVNSSESAARLLEEAGLIDDWRDFNSFLIENGYDRKISSKTFTFSGNETYEEIAAIITNGR